MTGALPLVAALALFERGWGSEAVVPIKKLKRALLTATIASAAILCFSAASPLYCATFTVDVLTDGVDFDPNDALCLTSTGTCTLRAAVQQANTAINPPHTILLPLFGTHTLDICCDLEDDGAEGDLDLKAWLEIVGVSPQRTTIEQTVSDRVFHCEPPGTTITLRNLTVTGGTFPYPGSGPQDGAGLLFTDCAHTLDNVVVDSNVNSSGGVGGNIAILVSDSVIRRSTVTGGDSLGGAAIHVSNGLRTALIEESLIYSNGSLFGPIGLWLQNSELTIRNSTLSDNGLGANATNIRLEGVSATLTLEYVTLAQGDSLSKNVRFDDNTSGATMYIKNSLIQHIPDDPAATNCDMGPGGSTISEGYNIDSSNNCQLGIDPSDSINTDAKLDFPLADHGGPTLTHALGRGSPAIDFIPAVFGCNGAVSQGDQRNAPRLKGCDAGAYEHLGCPLLALSDEVIFDTTELHECAISVGPNVTVTAPDGQLALTSGTTVRFYDGFTVESGGSPFGSLTAVIDRSLELLFSELVAAERRRRAARLPAVSAKP